MSFKKLMATEGIVHVRIDETVRREASQALAEMGLSISDAVRMLLIRVAREKAMPFEVRVPNAESGRTVEELRQAIQEGLDSETGPNRRQKGTEACPGLLKEGFRRRLTG